MDFNYYILFWICIVGLCLGSFYNVVILRSLSRESIVSPPSKCPKCGNKLLFWHNIPLLSYIILRGKCYFCKEKISIQYPIVELLTMLLFGGIYYRFGLSATAICGLIWISCLLIMTVTDLKEKIIDSNLAIIMAICGIIYNYIVTGWSGVLYSILGLIACVIAVEIFARLGYLFTKTRAMGEGDTYVAGAIGAIFTINAAFIVLLYSVISSLIFIVPMFLYKKIKQGDFIICLFSFLFATSIFAYEIYPCILSFVFLAGFGGALAFRVIKGMDTQNNMNYIPFVPALAIGTAICMWIYL